MGKAAAALSISQSTLSDTLNRLESAYGVGLFERDRRGSRPTVYGEVVVAAAARALRTMDEAHREIGLIRGSDSGRLAIGAEPGLVEPFLALAITQSLKRHPNLRFRVRALDSSTLAEQVRGKRLDLFFGVRPDASTRGLKLREIGVVDIVPFVRPGHPLADGKPHPLHAIMAYPIVQGPGPRWLGRQIAEEIRREDAAAAATPLDAAVIVNDFGLVRALVQRTDAVGLATAPSLRDEIGNGTFVCLPLPPPRHVVHELPMVIGTLAERVLPPSVELFIETLVAIVS
jgi:DNA-binding transcriptional LysR family regulator